MSVYSEDPSLISFSGSSSKSVGKQIKLKAKVQKLSNENAKLSKSLDQKTHEVNKLGSCVNELTRTISESSSASEVQIFELTKRNRHLNAELNAVKSKFKGLEKNLRNLENSLAEKDEQLKQSETMSNAGSTSPTEVQVINEKLEKTNKKVFEILNQNKQLKNELKMAQKCLQQEIGDNVSLAQIISGKSNWRGRAEQITMLQRKIAELKDKIENSDCFDSGDDFSRLPLKRLESMRRLEVDSLKKDLQECQTQLDDLKQKVCALKTRNKNLTEEANGYKLKTLDLLEKSSRDEEFIKLLSEQNSITKFEFTNQIDAIKKELDETKEDSAFEIQKLQLQIENQQDEIDNKENEIKNFKISINQLETNIREVSSDFLFSCREMSKDEYVTLLKNLEQEKNNLLGLMQQLNERLDKESLKVSEQHETIHKQRVKLSRLEAKLQELEAEKEAARVKHRRSIRISEYSRNQSHENLPSTHRTDQAFAEIDRNKFKLEVAMERIDFLEKKIKDQNEAHHEESQRFMEIIGKSKEIFKNLFDGKKKDDGVSTSLDTTLETVAEK